ncbi:uncharacterized protein B0H64DRAFT_62908 [Chaetomium fimeti]|uniref:Uncharacterized protein n=1 Tax=Chaetomium fimeti TaxID=1854472 RepID=A0AAE0LLZ3_9PEZI|nr:hypothetical protein B0H64DRAFT_62908 [Chaetomium fimeti]
MPVAVLDQIEAGAMRQGHKRIEQAKEDEEGQEMGEARPCKYHGSSMSIPHHLMAGWASAGLGAQGPRNGRRVSEQDCDSRSHSGAQRVCRSRQDRPAWAGTNLGLRCKWSGVACLAGMLGHREESPTPSQTHTPAPTPLSVSLQPIRSDARPPANGHPSRTSSPLGKNRSGLRRYFCPKRGTSSQRPPRKKDGNQHCQLKSAVFLKDSLQKVLLNALSPVRP